jgi:hypothetical protein
MVSKSFCQPGGHGLNALPAYSSVLGMTKCSSWWLAWLWRTQSTSYWSASKPAKATASKSSMTAFSCAGVTSSPGAQESTPAVNFQLRSWASINCRVMFGSPRSTWGGSSFRPG